MFCLFSDYSKILFRDATSFVVKVDNYVNIIEDRYKNNPEINFLITKIAHNKLHDKKSVKLKVKTGDNRSSFMSYEELPYIHDNILCILNDHEIYSIILRVWDKMKQNNDLVIDSILKNDKHFREWINYSKTDNCPFSYIHEDLELYLKKTNNSYNFRPLAKILYIFITFEKNSIIKILNLISLNNISNILFNNYISLLKKRLLSCRFDDYLTNNNIVMDNEEYDCVREIDFIVKHNNLDCLVKNKSFYDIDDNIIIEHPFIKLLKKNIILKKYNNNYGLRLCRILRLFMEIYKKIEF